MRQLPPCPDLLPARLFARNMLYIRALLRTLQIGIKNINPLSKNLSRLLRKTLSSSMRASTVVAEEVHFNLESEL